MYCTVQYMHSSSCRHINILPSTSVPENVVYTLRGSSCVYTTLPGDADVSRRCSPACFFFFFSSCFFFRFVVMLFCLTASSHNRKRQKHTAKHCSQAAVSWPGKYRVKLTSCDHTGISDNTKLKQRVFSLQRQHPSPTFASHFQVNRHVPE